jgi:hypothetical protein
MTTVQLKISSRKDKKFMVIIQNKTVHFGASGYSDYTQHKDHARMIRYDNRHRKNENWTINGILSAGFWAKWILWSKPDLRSAIDYTSKKFGITIVHNLKNSEIALKYP